MRIQDSLRPRVLRDGSPEERDVRFVAGCDVAFDRTNGRGVGAVVVVAYPSLEVVERVTCEAPVTFPYVPGLLSFRETPVLVEALERVRQAPDIVMVDGHGYAHPRRFGYACHLGLMLEVPTIGVAKSRLIGAAGAVRGRRGSRADVVDGGEVVGSMLRTRQGVRSIYVSIGHRIGLAAAERWALACSRGYRLPEPTRLADRLAGEAKRRMLEATLEMIVEQRAGEAGRWEWVAADGEIVFRHELEPMLTHYGCSVDVTNPADGELLDVMLIDGADRARGERLAVTAIDVLERTDGDDKLLAIPVNQEPPSPAKLDALRGQIWDWYVRHEKPVRGWGGADAARELIRSCRARVIEEGVAV